MRITSSALRTVAVAAALGLFPLATVHAQAVPPPETAPLLLPDAPPAVSGPPAPAAMSEKFAALDRDKDGSLSESEAVRDERVAVAFHRLDESGDGRLDLAEFAQLRGAGPRRMN